VPPADPSSADGRGQHADRVDEAAGGRGAARAPGPRAVGPGDAIGPGGRYELAEELGEGGMATVLRARDRELRREVAIKVLFPHLARRPEVVHRFQREARAAASLDHRNILRVYDVGGDAAGAGRSGGEGPGAPREVDPPFIVMELVRGRSLLVEIEQGGALLAELAAGVGALLADALAAAHAAGIVHRDVKPANVLIAPGGRLLLADFGVARLESEDSLVTRTGAVLGTPAYMSPEQAVGEVATARSDLYSLGATLYQLATGHVPYAGPPARVLSAIAAGQLVPPARRRAAVGPELADVIERLMARDPAARPASAAAVASQLRKIATGGGLGDATDELAAYFVDRDAYLQRRVPLAVSARVAAARRALAQRQLPRALALADRATSLAPDDPAARALVAEVTEGGRARRRRRAAVWATAGAALAGGVAAAAALLGGGPRGGARDAGATDGPAAARAVGDARGGAGGAGAGGPRDGARGEGAGESIRGAGAGEPIRGERSARTIGSAGASAIAADTARELGRGDPWRPSRSPAGSALGPSGAVPRAPRRAADALAGSASRDALAVREARAASPADRASAARGDPGGDGAPSAGGEGAVLAPAGAGSADAAPAAPPIPVDAAAVAVAALGELIIESDTWCELAIDGVPRGRVARTGAYALPAGRRAVRCEQPSTGLGWRAEVEIRPGAQTRIARALLPPVAVTIATPGDRASIDGVSAARGAILTVKPGQRRVVLLREGRAFREGWVAIPVAASCRLHAIDADRLACDP
jgi:serine/threonine-protein kinase